MTDPAAGQVEVPAPDGLGPERSGPDGSGPDGSADPGGDGAVPAPVDPEGSAETNDAVKLEPAVESEPAVEVEQPTATATAPATPMADFRMALVSSVTMDLPSQHPTVLLRELESPRRQLSFFIGLPDAVALAHALRRIATPRPLTHELVSGILQGFDIDVVAVRLVGRRGSIYFAELDLRGRTGRSVLSARPSDALTLALLQPVPAPILIDVRLLEEAGDVPPPG
jgi:bifunctional DNase/RNase